MKKDCSKNLLLKSPRLSSNLGFTIVELLIILSLIALLFTLGIAQYNRFNRSQTLTQTKNELVSNLRLAQGKSLAGEKPNQCGDEALLGHQLEFTNNQSYKIVAVCGSEPYPEVKQTVTFPEGVIKTSAENIVFFKILSQGVESEVTITLSGFGETRDIIITAAGEIK